MRVTHSKCFILLSQMWSHYIVQKDIKLVGVYLLQHADCWYYRYWLLSLHRQPSRKSILTIILISISSTIFWSSSVSHPCPLDFTFIFLYILASMSPMCIPMASSFPTLVLQSHWPKKFRTMRLNLVPAVHGCLPAPIKHNSPFPGIRIQKCLSFHFCFLIRNHKLGLLCNDAQSQM